MPPPPSTAAPGPRKGPMRKGTHSCYECRKRKVRCIFAKDATICDGCDARGRFCTEQRRDLLQAAGVDTGETLRERVARLEAIIEASATASHQTSNKIVGDPKSNEVPSESSSSSACNATPASTTSPDDSLLRESSQHIDPMVTLFDNAIWRSRSSNLPPERISKIDEAANPAAASKRIHTRELLLSDIMPMELLGMVMHATCSWWHTWRPIGPWLSASIGDRDASTLPDFVLWALKSSNPSIVGLAMLCIAVCLQQLDTRVHQYIIRQLPRLPGALFQEYFEKVNRHIVSDTDYGSTEQGIEVIMLSAKIYMNLGLHKKCWLLTHQAIAYGQLLGFHRPERLSAGETTTEIYRRNQSWLSLCAEDVYVSLLLGLPYAADGRTIPLTQNFSATSLLQHNLTRLFARVIDRNQMGLSLSVSRTDEITNELETATKDLDGIFWESPAALASGAITRPEYLEQIAAQCWYYQLLVLLHMPLMIHSVKDNQLAKHRIACLDASRKLLKVYHLMRSDPFSAFCMYKLIDHQAFVCSVLLVLGLMGYGSAVQEDANQHKDRDLINSTIVTLRRTSGAVNNPIASQAVQGLETLMMLSECGCPHDTGPTYENPYATLVVPFVGVITIAPGEHYDDAPKESATSVVQPPLEFTLCDSVLQEFPDPAALPISPSLNSTLDLEQANGLDNSNSVRTELASIDFDWSTSNTHNFEDDWAWLNELSY